MEVLSVNVGVREKLQRDQDSVETGIFKRPVEGAVHISRDGLPDDAICSRRHHGGPDQAVYIYGQPDYDWWVEQLSRELPPGIFGENLTISQFESATCRIGDRFVIGDVVLEITAPRVPCGTFAARMEGPAFAQRFRAAERPGVYCRVLNEGFVRAGMRVDFQPGEDDHVGIIEAYRDFYAPDLSPSRIRRFLAAPIAERMRRHKTDQLRRVQEA